MDVDSIDYESLPDDSTLATHLVAGAAAGIMEHSVMYPFDCVKTRMQVLVPDPRANYRNVPDAMFRICRYEGAKRTFRGISAVISGAGPAHAMYFASYEWVKKSLSSSNSSNHLVHGFAGCCATVFHDSVMNPAEVVKQRLQVFNSPYKGCIDCFKTVLRTEGIHAFYRSYTTQLTMNVPFQALHFMVYEFCQDKLNGSRSYNPVTHMLSGAMAGGLAAAATTPLDVCKTLLNTQNSSFAAQPSNNSIPSGQPRINGMFGAIRTIYAYRGMLGYFQGVSARVIYVMPGTAISWSVYESFKYFLTSQHDDGSYVTPSVLAAAAPVKSDNMSRFE